MRIRGEWNPESNTFVDRGVTWDDTLVVNKLDAIVLIALQHFCSNNKPWRAGSYIPKKSDSKCFRRVQGFQTPTIILFTIQQNLHTVSFALLHSCITTND